MHAAPTSLSVVHDRAPGAPRVQANRWKLHVRFPCRRGSGGLLRWLSIHLLNLLLLLLLLHCSSLVAQFRARPSGDVLLFEWWKEIFNRPGADVFDQASTVVEQKSTHLIKALTLWHIERNDSRPRRRRGFEQFT